MLCVKRLLFLLLNLVAGVLPPCFPFPILSALWLLIEFSSVVSWSFSPHKWFIQIKWSYWAKVKLGFNLPQVSFEPSPCLLLFVEMFLSLNVVFFKILFGRKGKGKKSVLGIPTAGARSRRCLLSEEVSWTSLLSLFRSGGWREMWEEYGWTAVTKSWFFDFLQYSCFSPVAKGIKTMSFPFCR